MLFAFLKILLQNRFTLEFSSTSQQCKCLCKSSRFFVKSPEKKCMICTQCIHVISLFNRTRLYEKKDKQYKCWHLRMVLVYEYAIGSWSGDRRTYGKTVNIIHTFWFEADLCLGQVCVVPVRYPFQSIEVIEIGASDWFSVTQRKKSQKKLDAFNRHECS